MSGPVLSISIDADFSEARRAALARDLVRDLRKSGFQVAMPVQDAPSRPGQRGGDFGLVADIVVTFLAQGTALALADCLKAYLLREKRLRLTLKTMDGVEVMIDPESIKDEKTQSFLRSVEKGP